MIRSDKFIFANHVQSRSIKMLTCFNDHFKSFYMISMWLYWVVSFPRNIDRSSIKSWVLTPPELIFIPSQDPAARHLHQLKSQQMPSIWNRCSDLMLLDVMFDCFPEGFGRFCFQMISECNLSQSNIIYQMRLGDVWGVPGGVQLVRIRHAKAWTSFHT